MSTTIAVLGSGSWGTAIALHLAKAGHSVRLWSVRAESGRTLAERRENTRLLPGVLIPCEIHLTCDPAEAVRDATLWVTAIPTQFLREGLIPLQPYRQAKVPVVSLSKGLELGTLRRPSEIIRDVLGERPVAVLSGPSHAEEVAQALPGSVVAACEDFDMARLVQRTFASERFRVYTNQDVVGVELAGALKNVLAIAAGVCDGLAFGDNAKSALITRGLAEMVRFGIAHGAEHTTFYGLAGLGDLITTCFSRHGRNRRVGERLGQGETLTDIVASTSTVAEGVATSRSVYERAKHMSLDMPIVNGVYRIVHENYPPMAAFTDLMLRAPRSEWGHA